MEAVKKALLGEVLTEEEAHGLMQAMMAGELSPVQVAGVLTAMALRGETPSEIAAMARAMREAALRGEGVAEALERGEEVLREAPEFRPDYLAIVHPQTLLPLSRFVPGARGIVAGRFPEVRLIDNLEVHP